MLSLAWLVQFIDSYDPPLKGLQEDLKFVSPRIGGGHLRLEAVGPVIFLSTDTRKLRNEGFLSPYHPRYPDILTNSAHPVRAQDLANVTSYREWVLLGYLVCPDELLRVTSIDIASVAFSLIYDMRTWFRSGTVSDDFVVLKENLILAVFRDEYALLHEDYQLYVLPRILESKKMARSGRTKQKEADLEYSVAKHVEKMIRLNLVLILGIDGRNETITALCEVHEQSLLSCDAIHHERRILLKQEIGRMVLFFTDQPSLLAPNIQMVFSSLALAQSEVIWYFQHVGIASSKSKAARAIPDPNDPTIGFLLDGMDHLCCLVRKYIAVIVVLGKGQIYENRFLFNHEACDHSCYLKCLYTSVLEQLLSEGYALSYLSSCAGRIRFLLGTPGMVALDLDASLKGLFQQIVQHLESISKLQGENISAIMCDLSEFRKDWLSILMIVTSARSSINIRHLEKATVSTGKEGLLSEGNAAYNWSRRLHCSHGKSKFKLNAVEIYRTSYRNHFQLQMRLSEHHVWTRRTSSALLCMAWCASSFPECASPIVPEEVTKIGRDAVLYVESLIESIIGGLEGLINILDSEGGFGALEAQLLPEQAAFYLNDTSRVSIPTSKSTKGGGLEAAMQRLTNLFSVLNDMEPICVLNHVFVLREVRHAEFVFNFFGWVYDSRL
ncbi:hypothetical protein POTOM_061609 [Populus tomentosa]|uniref:Uncharacterized protein n=1 Tax=Populus tomentosa TaxID=118781 RepID=A0A8X7XY19_POPTO|nr:hypothetical protein POTOM_061609 [Populus tomentosa]